jgi:hypothetical protein
MKITLIFALILSLQACSGPALRRPGSEVPLAPDYALIFKTARDVLIANPDNASQQEQVKLLLKVPENFVVGELQARPELLALAHDQLIAELQSVAPVPPDPTKHTRLIPPQGMPGYSDLQLYVNHAYYRGTKLIKKSNLIEVWKAFINKAEKEIIVNVFDFDLEEIADALIAKSQAGLDVRVGIDKKSVIDVRPEVKKIEEKLVAGGVKVTGVMPVGLNHQKITAIDWSDAEKSSVLFSSGNLTRSCLEPKGDLKGTIPLPKESLPNANHLITMKSWLLANLVHHELTKTLDAAYLLRGRQYPLNGSYQITGPGVDPHTLEAYPEPSITITFSPGGGLKSINRNLIADLIKRETGWIRMLQFAYSAAAVDEALLFRAQHDYQATGKFDFLSIGDTPFAMREWSRFLIMSGMKRIENPDKTKTYLDDPENPWTKGLSPLQLMDLRKRVRIAPKVYGEHHVKVQGVNKKVNAKIHHKILATPRFAIMGTSFNFSEGAESNNEQILVFRDSQLAEAAHGMVDYLKRSSPGSVASEASRRNRLRISQEEGTDPEDQVEAEP